MHTCYSEPPEKQQAEVEPSSLAWSAARHEASLASRRYEAVDPAKRLVARELESRWNVALERVAQLEQRLARMDEQTACRPQVDKDSPLMLAHDLASTWNAPSATMRTKQRLTRVLIQEVVINLDDAKDEVAMTVHWTGGRHTEIRLAHPDRPIS